VSVEEKNDAGNSYYRHTAVFISQKGQDVLADYLRSDKQERKSRQHDIRMLLVGAAISAFFSNLDRLIGWIKTW
jgi:hypothetical protein